MYVCDPCFDQNPKLVRGAMTCDGPCEWCGHFNNDWSTKFTQWVKNVTLPVGHADPKNYILDQLGVPDAPEDLVAAGLHMARKQAEMIRDYMDSFRKAYANSEDRYKNGWYDALDFMIRTINENLGRELEKDRTTTMAHPKEGL